MHYKARCLRMVAARSGQVTQASSDTNIQTVIFLVAYESTWGSPGERKIHANGLRRMIEERGGIHALTVNKPLAQQIWWIEFSGAANMIMECTCGVPTPQLPVPRAPMPEVQITPAMDTSRAADISRHLFECLRRSRSPGHLGCFNGCLDHSQHLDILTRVMDVGEFFDPGSPRLAYARFSLMARVASIFYIHACIATTESDEEAAMLLDDVLMTMMDNYSLPNDPGAGPNIFALLWTFTYVLNLDHEGNERVLATVLDLMAALNRLSWPLFEQVEGLVSNVNFDRHPSAVVEDGGELDEAAIEREIIHSADPSHPANLT